MPARSRLANYRAKRRFDRTPEPAGGAGVPDEPIFVIQKHAARRLHYDLRLQVGHTLRSWAVPEGPALDPKVRRFAKLVEDHPLDYAAFEGRIPEGEYGAGTVIVWDRGTWTSPDDIPESLDKGELKFRLSGKKLSGGWMLKRLADDPTNWLLIKERDPSARPLAEYDVLVEQPDSVVTGASVEAISPTPKARNLPAPVARKIRGGVAAPVPISWIPQLATPADAVPSDAGWVHEIKYDGYRTICLFNEGKVRLLTRNGHDWTERYAPVAKALAGLRCKSAIIDGEIVVQDARGVTQIGLLEKALAEGRPHTLVFFSFDLGYLDGQDIKAAGLLDRKKALERLIDPLIGPRSPIQYSPHADGDGAELFARACEMGLEGIVSKRSDSKYLHGRSGHWLKIKRSEMGEFPIIGFTTNAPTSVAALILAETSQQPKTSRRIPLQGTSSISAVVGCTYSARVRHLGLPSSLSRAQRNSRSIGGQCRTTSQRLPASAPSPSWSASTWALTVAMWWVMMIAMMSPSAAPTVLLYARVHRHSAAQGQIEKRAPPTGAFIAGYLLTWLGFSIVATALHWLLERQGVISATMMGSQSRFLSGGVLIAAGVYQFTPLKNLCLSHCRAPQDFLSRHWRHGSFGALRLGVVHGAYCVGCCWTLMALLFVGGIMNLVWIAALALLVLAEKVAPAGRWIGRGMGLLFLAWGAATFFV